MLWTARRLFWGLTLGGAAMLLYALAGTLAGGERLSLVLIGLGTMMGGGGTLALSYGVLAGSDVFPVRVCVRIGFLLAGLGCAGAELFQPAQLRSWGGVLAGVLFTIPFALSLLRLCWRRKKGR